MSVSLAKPITCVFPGCTGRYVEPTDPSETGWRFDADEPDVPAHDCWPNATHWVNVYRLERHYGGPEEGGWWYASGDVVRSYPVQSEEAGLALAEVVRLSGEYPETEERFSMAPRGTDYGIYVEETPGQSFPDERPFYC